MSKTAVLLIAAGLSARMGRFKPLVELDGTPLINHAIDSFRTIDICETVVVTGHCREELEAHLRNAHIKTVYNPRYADTEMIDSIKLGLSCLQGKCDCFFLLPADMPLVQPFTIEVLNAYKTDKPIVQPAYHNKHGHPLLINASCIPQILPFTGEGGLKGALEPFGKEIVDIPDPGIAIDADTPEAFDVIKTLYHQLEVPSREMSLFMLKWYANSERIVRHCETVARVAANIAKLAVERGWSVDIHLIESAALLHDITKNRGNSHAKTGGVLLARLGYSKVGRVVATHTDLPYDAIARPDERAVVYLADKLVKNDSCVGVKRHFAGTFEKYARDSVATAAIQQRLDNALVIMKKLGITDDDCLDISGLLRP